LSLTIPNCEPDEITAGNYVPWNRYPDFKLDGTFSPADGWELSYVIIGAAKLDLSEGAQITAQSTYWEVRIPTTDSEKLQSGKYTWAAYVQNGSERYEADRGTFIVRENLAASSASLSFNRQMLNALKKALLDAAPNALTVSFQINGRAVNLDRKQVMIERGIYEQLVWQEENPGVSHVTHEVRFVNP
jgi:hypothetical protein